MNKLDIKYVMGCVALLLLMLIPVLSAPEYAQADQHLYQEVAGNLMCLCGCGSTIKSCPHKNCGFANPIKDQIKEFIKQGQTKEQIISYFVQKNGEKILTAPIKEGFNLVGYLLPGVVIIISGIILFLVLGKWTGQHEDMRVIPADSGENGVDETDASYKERLEKELEEYDE